MKLTPEDEEGMHGNNERISVDNLKTGARVLYDVLVEVACTPNSK
jgi:acetylornithine deacetylase/succinyl-diaminopimelate desuccinylase-like protein